MCKKKTYSINFKWLVIAFLIILYFLPSVVMARRPSFRTSTKVINRAIQTNIKKIIKPSLTINSRYADAMTSAVFSENGQWIATAGKNGYAQLWDVNTGQKVMDFAENSESVTSLIFSLNAKYLFTGNKKGEIYQWDIDTGKKIRNFSGHLNEVYSMVPLSGQQILSAGADGTINLWDTNSGVLLQSFAGDGGAVFSIAVSDNKSKVVGGYNDGKIRIWDIKSGKILQILNGNDSPVFALDVSSDSGLSDNVLSNNLPANIPNKVSNNILAAGFENGKVMLWNLANSKKIMDEKRHDGAIRALAISHDNVFFVTGGDDKIIRVSSLQGKKICDLPGHHDTVNAICFSQKNDFLLTASSDKTTRIWSIENEKELARLISMRSGWAVVSPDGFFDGTLDGDLEDRLDAIQWSVGDKSFSVDGFMEKYYKPALLGRIFAQQPVRTDKTLQVISDGFTLPPTMEISLGDFDGKGSTEAEKISVTVKATDQGGGIDGIRLYHNGKVVDDAKSIIETKKEGKKIQKIKVYEIALVKGENSLKTIGLSDSRIESEAVETAIEQIIKEEIKIPTTLHIVTVGINIYKNPFLDLRFAVPDAKGVSKQFSQAHSKTFDNVALYELYNKEATKAKINATLEILQTIPPQDTVLIYLAGHGETLHEKWYFIPYDLYDPANPDKLKSKGISSDNLELLIVKINAQRIFLLMDSCKSGAALNAFSEFDAHKPFALLSRATGIHVGAAATGRQSARELSKIKHGVFTYTLLEAVSGAADNNPANGDITVSEVLSYVKNSMPDVIKKYGIPPQSPIISSRGMNFKLAEINQKEQPK